MCVRMFNKKFSLTNGSEQVQQVSANIHLILHTVALLPVLMNVVVPKLEYAAEGGEGNLKVVERQKTVQTTAKKILGCSQRRVIQY